nr:DUF3710 domain-containing protein [Klugiella xanthotipulae]
MEVSDGGVGDNEVLVDETKSAPDDRAERGPLDVAEASAVRPYVDLGSIKVLPREGLQLRLDVEDGTQRIVAVSLDYADSTLQVQAFSAPRSTGLWHEVRGQIFTQLSGQGLSIVEQENEFGPELQVDLVNQATAAVNRVRFVGVDGPRWLLRGVVSGAAVNDLDAADKIHELFRSIVVVRGDLPLPPRDLLPLRVPTAATAAAEAE